MKRKIAAVLAGILAAGLLAACGAGVDKSTSDSEKDRGTISGSQEETSGSGPAETASEPEAEKTRLLVAAAASLKNAFDDKLIPMFEEKYPDIEVEGTYDASGKLQTQIEGGLEADVFMSAAPRQMNALDEEGLIDGDTRADLLENKIVLIVPADGGGEITMFEDIVKAGSIAIGDPASVPVGQYTREALTNLGIWEDIQDKVSLGTNVTEVLNQVAAESAEAGVVYATDAASMADQVRVVAEAPEGSVSEAVYPVAVVKTTEHAEQAREFVKFLKTPEAAAVFEGYGFTSVPGSKEESTTNRG